jgi:hypothetical protein
MHDPPHKPHPMTYPPLAPISWSYHLFGIAPRQGPRLQHISLWKTLKIQIIAGILLTLQINHSLLVLSSPMNGCVSDFHITNLMWTFVPVSPVPQATPCWQEHQVVEVLAPPQGWVSSHFTGIAWGLPCVCHTCLKPTEGFQFWAVHKASQNLLVGHLSFCLFDWRKVILFVLPVT